MQTPLLLAPLVYGLAKQTAFGPLDLAPASSLDFAAAGGAWSLGFV